MQHNSFITSTNLRQHVVANKPTNKYKRCMSSHKTILCHRVFFFWPNPKYFSADYPAASVGQILIVKLYKLCCAAIVRWK